MPKEIKSLIQGYRRFREQYFSGGATTYECLAKFGQHPRVIMIGCSDSRVDPAILTNCDPGDIFVVRNVANLVPPFAQPKFPFAVSAALEFAIVNLKVRHIVILGHSRCGGIEALMQKDEMLQSEGFIADWMKLAKASRRRALKEGANKPFEEQVDLCARYSIIDSLANLLTFPFIVERIESRDLFIHGWYFDLSVGLIYEYNPETLEFDTLALEE